MYHQEQIDRQLDTSAEGTYLESALTRSVSLMAEQRRRLGDVTPELKAMILDEELTPVLEVIVNQTNEAYGVVPRAFRVEGDDIIDPHGQSLTEVVERGREWSRQEVAQGVPGAWKELQRRTAEARNVATIAQMSPGTLCLEISANPIDWTPEEKEAQHYTDLTMLRVSLKPLNNPNQVTQLNFVLPNLNTPESILNLQEKLGVAKSHQTIDTQQMLARPLIKECETSEIEAGREIDGLLGAVLLEKSVGHSTLRMIKRAIERRREAWRFVTDGDQVDVHSELLAHIESLSIRNPQLWDQGMAAIRTGLTRELKDRFLNRRESVTTVPTNEGGILVAAAGRAVESGDVYPACGNTVVATEFSVQASTPAGRAEIVKNLRENVVGSGNCGACGAKSTLYGCGLCGNCNKKWCDIYEQTGEQTDIKDLASPRDNRDSRPYLAIPDFGTESFSQYWKRIGEEIKRERQIRKIKRPSN